MGPGSLDVPYDGLAPSEVARRVGVARCLSADVLDSTLDIVHREAAAGEAEVLVLADEQVAGRGRQGAAWHSAPGQGLLVGFLLRPPEPVAGGILALRVGIALADVAMDMGAPAQLKWPNDVVLHDRKLAGVLCEARHVGGRHWLAIGIGINVHAPVPPSVRDTAIALDEVVRGVRRVDVLEALVPKLRALSSRPELMESERIAFGARNWLEGKRLVSPVKGVAYGLAPDGALVVETDAGMQRIVGGSVRCA